MELRDLACGPRLRSLRDIYLVHGLFVSASYACYIRLRVLLPTRWWLSALAPRLSRMVPGLGRHIWDPDTLKAAAPFQDLGVLLHAATTAALVGLAMLSAAAYWYHAAVAIYLLVDIVGYHAGTIWWDDLIPGKSPRALRVWSHRRVLFQALANFGELIALFTVLHMFFGSDCGWMRTLFLSFTISTGFATPDELAHWLVAVQVMVSLFLVVAVIGLAVALGYRRRELAPDTTRDYSNG